MPKMTTPLNPKAVRGLRPRLGRARDVWWDVSPTGFGVRCSKGRPGTYIVRYRVRGRARWLVIGRVDVLSLSEARERARAALREVAAGRDPQEAKLSARAAADFATVIRKFIEAGKARRHPKTIYEYRRILKAEIERSPVGRMPANAVSAPDLDAILEGIARRAPAMANRVYTFLRAASRWAFKKDLLDRDIAAKVDQPRPDRLLSAEERTLTDEELVKVWRGIEDIKIGWPSQRAQWRAEAAVYVRLLILCGTRRTETALAEWSHIDLAARLWTIPPENRKGRIGRKRGLLLPLSPLAARLLQDLKATLPAAEGRIFTGLRSLLLENEKRFNTAMREAAGVEFGLHDLRATCATGCGRLGTPPYVIALILGHAGVPGTPEVTSLYDRADRVPEVRSALNAWAVHVERLVSGEARRAEVVPLVRA